MFIILLFYIANAAQPETSVQLQKLDYTSYHLIVNQSKILYENPNCFQIFLWKRTIQDKNRYMYQDEDYDVIVQEENKILGIPGCSAMQKAFPITQHIKLYLPSNDKIFYTDLIVLDNRALIIRNDLTLQEVHISEKLFTKTAKQQKLNIQTSKQTHPIFLWDQNIKRVYIISESGGVSIPDWISIGEPTFFINQEKFKQRNIIYDAFLKNNKIYVASGAEGLDVYKYQNGAILHENVILRIDNQHLTAMDVSGDDQNLYILDHNYGLYVCDYEFNLKFKVPVLKGSDFGHYKNTFFIIAESITRQDYALEVFLNFTDNTFYFNHYYLDEMSFYDVKVYENYAVLIGYEAHKIISHSVFSGFIKFSSDNYFEMSQLMQMKQWNNSFVGLGKRELRLMTIKEEPAHIWCQSQQMFQEHYLVAYYLQNETNPFDAKLYKQVFQLVVDDVALLTKANLILLALFLIIIFIIVLISAAAIILYRYYKNKTDKLEEDKKILTQQASIDKEEGPGQELSAL